MGKKAIALYSAAITLVPYTAFAAFTGSDPCQGQGCKDKILILARTAIDKYLLNWAGVIFVIVIIYGGLVYITSAGNQGRADSGKKTLTTGVIGLLIIIVSKVAIQTFAKVLGGEVGF